MEQLYIYEKSGKKRKAEYYKCEECGKQFLRRIKEKRLRKYCCSECANKASMNRIEVMCSNCGEIIYKKPSQIKASKHGYYFCNRKCKEAAQRLDGNCPEIRPPHYHMGESLKRKKNLFKESLKDNNKYYCCGCKEEKVYLLQVHHKDGNRCNNTDDNLEIVCSNCHIKRHLRLVDDKWIFDTKSLTPRNLLDIL